MTRYLFLDVDGVLNTFARHDQDFTLTLPDELAAAVRRENPHPSFIRRVLYGYEQIEADRVARVNAILQAVPDTKVVLSSDWRRFWSLNLMNQLLRARGATFELLGATGIWPEEHGAFRGLEIEDWLKDYANGIIGTHFAALDDQARIGMKPIRHRLVSTNSWVGLLDEHVEPTIAMLLADPGCETEEQV